MALFMCDVAKGEVPYDECGLGELRPEELVGCAVNVSSKPADLWKRDSLFTTRVAVCVRTPTAPPYGVTGKMCVVPRSVETATHRESGLNATSSKNEVGVLVDLHHVEKGR
jgi:hypothetical protein